MKIQNKIDKIDTIVFDFDGTLHDGKMLSLPIYQRCLRMFHEKYGIPREIPSDTEILSQFGKQTEEIYPSILHSTDLNVIDEFSECIETAEIQAFNEGKGKLYPEVLKILNVLKLHGYRLALCTNARIDYFEAIVRNFPLENYFDLMFTAGQYPGKDKTWMVRRIIEKLHSQHFAVVGDRVHDFKAAKANKGIAIGCSYGFGSNEVEKADLVINAFEELGSIFTKRVLSR